MNERTSLPGRPFQKNTARDTPSDHPLFRPVFIRDKIRSRTKKIQGFSSVQAERQVLRGFRIDVVALNSDRSSSGSKFCWYMLVLAKSRG
jgi:hypothetical protein